MNIQVFLSSANAMLMHYDACLLVVHQLEERRVCFPSSNQDSRKQSTSLKCKKKLLFVFLIWVLS